MHYVHKYQVWQEFGGPEEGGWWYTMHHLETDFEPPRFGTEDEAYAECRELNFKEYERREREEEYEFTSVLSDRCTFYSYDVQDTAYAPEWIPAERPHYE